MARDDPHFRLRFPDELRKKVEASALENRRSMTAEILARLEGSFLPSTNDGDMDARLFALGDQIDFLFSEIKGLRQEREAKERRAGASSEKPAPAALPVSAPTAKPRRNRRPKS